MSGSRRRRRLGPEGNEGQAGAAGASPLDGRVRRRCVHADDDPRLAELKVRPTHDVMILGVAR